MTILPTLHVQDDCDELHAFAMELDGWVTDDEDAWQDYNNATHFGPEAERLYCSISLLLWSASLDSPDVEKVVRDCVRERVASRREVIHSMEEICHPFFFAERGDDTKWKPHDLYPII